MKLSDVMSAAGLASYAEVGLVLFLAAFLVVAIRVFWFERSDVLEAVNRIPLDDEQLGRRPEIVREQEGEAS